MEADLSWHKHLPAHSVLADDVDSRFQRMVEQGPFSIVNPPSLQVVHPVVGIMSVAVIAVVLQRCDGIRLFAGWQRHQHPLPMCRHIGSSCIFPCSHGGSRRRVGIREVESEAAVSGCENPIIREIHRPDEEQNYRLEKFR